MTKLQFCDYFDDGDDGRVARETKNESQKRRGRKVGYVQPNLGSARLLEMVV
jgi:hypothetical protein